MELKSRLTLERCQHFILLVIFTLALLSFMCGFLLTDQTSKDELYLHQLKEKKISRLVVMLVDALRVDWVLSPRFWKNWPNVMSLIKSQIASCSVSHLQPPTVTLPRIKAITTGRAPKFIDVLLNIESDELRSDAWIKRLNENEWKLHFYGDDTWVKLFPSAFVETDGTSSFFVNDFEEVDSNVSRHLPHLLVSADKWDGLLLHYLGLDHIGHVEGPNGRSVPAKLRQMDSVVGLILNALQNNAPFKDERWLFVLTGDHGTSDRGGHGGASVSETTTPLFYFTPYLSKVPNANQICALEDGVVEHSAQVDIATSMGLLTGVGIPSGSLGLISQPLLDSFWPTAREKLRVLYDLLRHFAALSGCADFGNANANEYFPNLVRPNCISKLLTQKDVFELNLASKQVLKGLECSFPEYLKLLNLTAPTDCGQDLTPSEVAVVTQTVIRLLRRLQSKALTDSGHSDIGQMWFGCAVMWLTSMFLLGRLAWVFCRTKSGGDHEKTKKEPNEESLTISISALCQLAGIALLIHAASLPSSSFIEEEHQIWYHLGTTGLLLIIIFLLWGDRAKSNNSTSERFGVWSLVLLLLLDRLLLRKIHQTGDKWKHLPDLSLWLYEPTQVKWLWTIQVLCWIALLVTRMAALSRPKNFAQAATKKPFHAILVCVSLCSVAISQLAYRWAIASERGTYAVGFARLCYILLLIDCWLLWRYSPPSLTLKQVTLDSPMPKLTLFRRAFVHPVQTIILLICLLGRPAVTLLWTGVLLKEATLASLFQRSINRSTQNKQTRLHLCAFIWMFYWIQGWVTYFQQGNSSRLSTVDVSAGYVGLTGHRPIITGFLLAVHTFSGPLFWQMAYVARFQKLAFSRRSRPLLSYLILLCFTLPITICSTVCIILRHHLFIWTVFTPKIFYLAVLHIFALPLLCLWTIN